MHTLFRILIWIWTSLAAIVATLAFLGVILFAVGDSISPDGSGHSVALGIFGGAYVGRWILVGWIIGLLPLAILGTGGNARGTGRSLDGVATEPGADGQNEGFAIESTV